MKGHCQLPICFDMFCHWSLGQLPLMFLFGVASLRRCYSYRHLGDALLSQRFELQATFSFKLALTSCQHLSPNRLSTLEVGPAQLELTLPSPVTLWFQTHLQRSTWQHKVLRKNWRKKVRKHASRHIWDNFDKTLKKLWETWRQPWDSLR